MERNDTPAPDAVPNGKLTVGDVIRMLEPYAECEIDAYVIGISIPLTRNYFRDLWGHRLTTAGLLKELNDFYSQNTAHNDIKSLLADT